VDAVHLFIVIMIYYTSTGLFVRPSYCACPVSDLFELVVMGLFFCSQNTQKYIFEVLLPLIL
jgi:hypothetical protein